MIRLRVHTDGQREMLQRFLTMPEAVKARIRLTLESLGGQLQAHMHQRMEAQLRARTHKLDRSFYHLVASRDGGNLFILTTGVRRKAFYAAFHDKGVSHPQADVRRYTRGGGRGRGRRGRELAGTYKRDIILRARPFIGISLEEMKGEIISALAAAVRGGTGGP